MLLVFACGMAAVTAVHAATSSKPAAQVTVRFVSPEKFTDVKDEFADSGRNRDWVLGELKTQIESQARNYLAAGQSLEVQVTDVDLAGDFEPWQGINFDRIRMIKEIYPPRMTLEFRLTDAEGKVVAGGKRSLQNLGYLMSITMPTNDPLRYDKELLRDWMRQEFKRAS